MHRRCEAEHGQHNAGNRRGLQEAIKHPESAGQPRNPAACMQCWAKTCTLYCTSMCLGILGDKSVQRSLQLLRPCAELLGSLSTPS